MPDMSLAALLPSQDPILLALIVLFLLISGIIKGFLGIGLPAAGMALLTLIMPPTEAIALLWVPIIASNAWQFARAPSRRDIIMSYRWFAAAIVVSILLAVGGFYVAQDLQIGDLDPGAPELRPDSRYNQDVAYMINSYSVSTRCVRRHREDRSRRVYKP